MKVLNVTVLLISLIAIFNTTQIHNTQTSYATGTGSLFNTTQIHNTQTSYVTGTGNSSFGIAAGDRAEVVSSATFAQELDGYKALGAGWVRIDIDWANIQAGGKTSYNWTLYDAAVSAATARGIKVLGIIDYTPSWELATGCTDNYFCPPKSNADYATFAAAVAARYAPMRVHTWEIWNEPNVGNGQSPRFSLASYTALLKGAYTAIKRADATATVLTGGTAPAATNATDFSPIDFLMGIYKNGGRGYFDAIAHHPYCYGGTSTTFNCPKTYASWSSWSQMQDTNPSLRSVMTANGDQGKRIWATEFGAPTGGTATYAAPVTEAQQAQMVTDAYTLFKSYSWAGPLFLYTYIDPCTTTTNIECYFGLVRADGSQKPAYAAYHNLTSATPAVTQVTSLSESGTSAQTKSTLAFTLQTSGTLPVDTLSVSIRDKNNTNYDISVTTNSTLSGTQLFSTSKTLAMGTYTYWITYTAAGVVTNLSPTKSFTVVR